MRLLHTGDLHIGKNLSEFSLLEDQRFCLEQIVSAAKEYKVDGVIIAGDLYDRSVPPAEAVSLVDEFVTSLIDSGIAIYCISGNHDSPERIGFANAILEKKGFYIDSQLGQSLKKIEYDDNYGRINIYMLPFLREPLMRDYCKRTFDTEIANYEEGIKCILSHENIDKSERNILITHYFVTDSGKIVDFDGVMQQIEEKDLGGLGNVDASVFKDFDYVALGHIHGFMRIGKQNVYYSGSPVKYSLREYKQEKSFLIVDINEKVADMTTHHLEGKVGEDINADKKGMTITRFKFKALHDLRRIEGKLEDLISDEVVNAANPNDYIDAVLLDEGDLYDPIGKLRTVYPNVMHISYKRDEKVNSELANLEEGLEEGTPLDVFKSFFKYVTDEDADETYVKIAEEIIDETDIS
ncbi:MAG: exonuclease SbcCD subunit D [Lachnospiraceae bacterium]|nr:exonuclease SbcCD subunit D [Lachnospiraceae bacterium]